MKKRTRRKGIRTLYKKKAKAKKRKEAMKPDANEGKKLFTKK